MLWIAEISVGHDFQTKIRYRSTPRATQRYLRVEIDILPAGFNHTCNRISERLLLVVNVK